MKEMTIEQKSKAYDKAYERAKKLKETCDSNAVIGWMEYIFPELKESEDEKIRKWIIENIQETLDVDGFFEEQKTMAKNAIAWLEKQGQVKESLISHHENKTCKESDDSLTSEDIRKGLIQYFSTFTLDTFAGLDPKKILSWLEKQGEHKPIISDDALREGIAHFGITQYQIDNWLKKYVGVEKQGEQKKELLQELDDKLNNTLENETSESLKKFLNEQKPTDKIEPKFHEGEWMVTDKNNVVQIKAIEDSKYVLENTMRFSVDYVDKCWRKWTIQDAKDGDVLVNWNNTAFIFKAIEDETVKFHIAYNEEKWDAVKTPSTKLSHLGLPEPQFEFRPATKEQHDALMKAMADAGYNFNFEKKELKKIIVPIFNIGDTIAKKHNSDIHDFGSFVITDITGGKYWYNDRIICDITEQDEWELYEPVRQNSTAWSEEDERMLDGIIEASTHHCYLNITDIDWLKSLKGRVQQRRNEKTILKKLEEWLGEYVSDLADVSTDILICSFKNYLDGKLQIPLKDKVQPKQEWSKEDDNTITSIIASLSNPQLYTPTIHDIEWLKSLNERYTWKPSDEQIEEFRDLLDDINWEGEILVSLYNDLKKLREK